MKMGFVKNILTFSILATVVTPVVWADDNSPVGIQRSFVNLGFETAPNLSYRQGLNDPTNQWECRLGDAGKGYDNKGNWNVAYCIFNQEGVEGWKTTATKRNGIREIELWKKGRLEEYDENWGPKAAEGTIYAELNPSSAAAIYQNVCVSKDDKLTWSFQHRMREREDEQAGFFIGKAIDDTINGIPSNITYLKKTEAYSTYDKVEKTAGDYYIDKYRRTINTSNPDILPIKWKKYSSNEEKVELGQYLESGVTSALMSFGFVALQSGQPSRGNWLDDIKLKLKPAVEFSAINDQFVENAEGEYPIRFKMVGLIESQDEMPILNFKIDYSDEEVDKTAEQIADLIDKRLKYGEDYKISSKTGELSAIKVDGTTVTFTYKPLYDSALDYTKGVEVTGLTIALKNNDKIEGDKRLPVSFDLNKDSNAVSMSLSSCDQVTNIQKFELMVMDDDVDLAVNKTMLTDQSTFANNNMRVSYEINLSNNDRSIARDVFLRDELFSNLEWDTNTQLTCVANSEKAVCPTLPQDALNQLFNEGLSLGNLPANTKLKFVLSNLKLKSTDEKKKDYEGLVINKAEVSAKGSNDVNLENNISTAENLYPAESDLMNDHDARTGEGLFKIEQDGAALWTQVAHENKAYFPLKIQNKAKLKQDYQLYASSIAIQPTIAEQKLSSLKKGSIGSYTDQIKIEFFELSNGQCNSNIPSAKQITQLEVKAESIGEVCAVITIYPSAKDKYDIWFAIESIQTGLGDIIRDAVTSVPFVQRLLELLNDQKAQVNVGGSFVFLHRLLNHGTDDEKDISLQLVPVNGDDGFLYSLFVDKNNDGQLDAKDEMVTSLDQKYSLGKAEVLQLLVKVQSPATATNGMMSQIKLEAIPSNENQSIFLESLINTDTVFVGSDQVQVTKTQFKRENCTAMSADEIEKAKYTVSSQTIGANDCLIYKISIKNTGSEVLKNIDVNDMYPAYTHKWELGQNILPMTSSGEVVEVKGDQVKTTILELLPQQEKSLYFGIKLN